MSNRRVLVNERSSGGAIKPSDDAREKTAGILEALAVYVRTDKEGAGIPDEMAQRLGGADGFILLLKGGKESIDSDGDNVSPVVVVGWKYSPRDLALYSQAFGDVVEKDAGVKLVAMPVDMMRKLDQIKKIMSDEPTTTEDAAITERPLSKLDIN